MTTEVKVGAVTEGRVEHVDGETLRRNALLTLVGELITMVEKDPGRDTVNAQAFLGNATRQRTRNIGRELWRFGGETPRMMLATHGLMREAYGPVYARMLEQAWDGIGDWRG